MRFSSIIKEFLYKIDFFNTREVLRYRDEPEYRTLTGGFISLAITITILATFAQLVLTTLDKIQITTTSLSTRDYDPPESIVSTYPDSNFMFGVEIWHHDLNTGDRYFDVVLLNKWLNTGENTNNTVQYKLEPCRKEHWASYPKVVADYDRLHMNYWLCPPMNTSFQIKGKFASELSKTLEVSVRKCKNATDPTRPCANQSTIDAYMVNQGQIFYTVYFMNPLINPSEQDYMNIYLEDNNYIIFSQTTGSEGILYLSDYSITTDESIWPFTNTRQQNGSLVNNFALKNPYAVTSGMDVYCFFSFYKGSDTTVYNRSFQKIADVVSYIGGLFGAVTTALMIFTVYNGYSFQITLGGYLFKPEEDDGNLFKKYNFLKFLASLFYSLLKMLKICTNWTTMNKYLEGRKHMLKELDVLYLLQRIQFLERSICTLLSDHQFKGLHLQQRPTMEEAKRIRSHFQLRKNILKKIEQNNVRRRNSRKIPQNDFSSKNQINLHESVNNNLTDNIRVYPEQKNGNKIANSQAKKFDDISSENSSDIDHLEDVDLAKDLQKLREEAEKGCLTSKKIWRQIDEQIIHSLTHYKHQHHTVSSKFEEDQTGKERMQNQIEDVVHPQKSFYQKNQIRGEFQDLDEINHQFQRQFPKEAYQMNELIKENKKLHEFSSKDLANGGQITKEIHGIKTVFYGETGESEQLKIPSSKWKKEKKQTISSSHNLKLLK